MMAEYQHALIRYVRRTLALAASLMQNMRRDHRGNVLMIFGLSLIPLTFATGMVIDYSRATRLQTKMNAAADAAALAATRKAMMNQPLEAACNAARNTFLNSLQQNSNGLVFNNNAGPTISIKETYEGKADVTSTCPTGNATMPNIITLPALRSITVSYAASSLNAFGGVLRKDQIDIGGSATARSTNGAYFQVVFVVDISNSMAIGGTAADISKLANDPTIKCSFACHDPNALIAADSSDYCDKHSADTFCRQDKNYCPSGWTCGKQNHSTTYSDRSTLARSYGYKLKIDYVKDALNSFMTRLKPKMDDKPTHFSVSLQTFGSQFITAQAATSSAADLQTAINKIDVEIAARYVAGYGNQGWTFTSTGLQSTLDGLRNVGDGSSPTQRTTYVIFLSDGVEDDIGNIIYNRGTYYNYQAKCDAIKAAGATMFSIETAYPVVTDDADGQYRRLIRDLPSRNNGKTITDTMKGCASAPTRYFLANDGPGIQNAVDSVFSTIDAETSHLIG